MNKEISTKEGYALLIFVFLSVIIGTFLQVWVIQDAYLRLLHPLGLPFLSMWQMLGILLTLRYALNTYDNSTHCPDTSSTQNKIAKAIGSSYLGPILFHFLIKWIA